MGMIGAVLAGGRSSRMGTDKALIRLEPDGVTLLEIAIGTLQPFCDEVIVVGPARPEISLSHVRFMPDAIADIGPLGGIATALEAADGSPVVVLSCDMPFVPAPLVEALVEADPGFDVVIPRTPGVSRQGGAGVFQTLCARYGGKSLAAIRRSIASGDRRVVSFFSDVRLRAIEGADLERVAPNSYAFFSVNTPGALDEARNLVSDHRPDAR